MRNAVDIWEASDQCAHAIHLLVFEPNQSIRQKKKVNKHQNRGHQTAANVGCTYGLRVEESAVTQKPDSGLAASPCKYRPDFIPGGIVYRIMLLGNLSFFQHLQEESEERYRCDGCSDAIRNRFCQKDSEGFVCEEIRQDED